MRLPALLGLGLVACGLPVQAPLDAGPGEERGPDGGDPGVPGHDAGAADAGPGFEPVDERQGSPDVGYLDPEVDPAPGANRVVFLDSALTVWVGALDPQTGRLVSATGQDRRVGSANVFTTRLVNGPEWGVASSGSALFYNGPDDAGVGQVFRATPPFDRPVQLTSTSDGRSVAVANLTQHGGLDRVLVMGYRGRQQGSGLAWTPGTLDVVQFDERAPGMSTLLPFPDRFHRWIPGTTLAVFASAATTSTLERGQVYLLEADGGAIATVSRDEGRKVSPWGFFAPELAGELVVVAVVDGRALAFYRRAAPDRWERVATLAPTVGTPFTVINSAEPVAGAQGFGGRSLVTFEALTDDGQDSSIWLVGPSFDGGTPLIRRLDEGARTGQAGSRRDPETFAGTDELFAYYTLSTPGGRPQLRLCRTGILRR